MEIAEVLKGLSKRMEKAVNAVNKYEAAINKVPNLKKSMYI